MNILENTPKNAKNNYLPKSKEWQIPKYKLGKGPVFTFNFTGGRFTLLPPVSYATATDQVHFKHEQPQVLLMESHITIGTIQKTQVAASVL